MVNMADLVTAPSDMLFMSRLMDMAKGHGWFTSYYMCAVHFMVFFIRNSHAWGIQHEPSDYYTCIFFFLGGGGVSQNQCSEGGRMYATVGFGACISLHTILHYVKMCVKMKWSINIHKTLEKCLILEILVSHDYAIPTLSKINIMTTFQYFIFHVNLTIHV